jgi:hypothetical protein
MEPSKRGLPGPVLLNLGALPPGPPLCWGCAPWSPALLGLCPQAPAVGAVPQTPIGAYPAPVPGVMGGGFRFPPPPTPLPLTTTRGSAPGPQPGVNKRGLLDPKVCSLSDQEDQADSGGSGVQGQSPWSL